MKCPNCKSYKIECLAMYEMRNKMFSCRYCGTEFNPGDTKETAVVPHDVDTPQKLAEKIKWQERAENRLNAILNKNF